MLKYAMTVVVIGLLSLAGCSTGVAPPQLYQGVRGPQCQERKLVANVWSYQLLPYVIQEKATELMAKARSRNTLNGTNPAGYEGDAVSRTLGFILRNDVKNRAPIDMLLRVYYLDPQTAQVERFVGIINVKNGTGSFQFVDDPRKRIVETVWPEFFISPIESGGGRRLWLFGEEWQFHCTMNIHGLVP